MAKLALAKVTMGKLTMAKLTMAKLTMAKLTTAQLTWLNLLWLSPAAQARWLDALLARRAARVHLAAGAPPERSYLVQKEHLTQTLSPSPRA